MIYLILIIALILVGFYLKNYQPEKLRRFFMIAAIALLAILALRFGQVVVAALMVALPFIFKAARFFLGNMGLLRMLAQNFSGYKKASANTNKKSAVNLSKAEALEILGLKPGATKSEIEKQYKKLMKTTHPDVGGSKHLASLLNAAKDKLL